MKLIGHIISILSLSTLAACAGSGGAKGVVDATSRKNALSASISASGGANPSDSPGLAYRWASADTLYGNETQTAEVNEKCERGGSFSGRATLLSTETGSETITLEGTFNKCATIEDGRVSGTLKMVFSTTSQSDSFEMILHGKVSAEGKNSEGKMADHVIEYDNFTVIVDFSPDSSSNSEFAITSSLEISCSGSMKIDGQVKTCQEILSEGRDDDGNDGPNYDAGVNLSQFIRVNSSMVWIIKRANKSVASFGTIEMKIDGEYTTSFDGLLTRTSVSSSELSNYMTEIFGSSVQYEAVDGASLVIIEDSMDLLDATELKVIVNYSDGSSETLVEDFQ